MSKEKYINLEDKGLIWDVIKMEIRSASISHSKFKAKQNRDKLKETFKLVDQLEK